MGRLAPRGPKNDLACCPMCGSDKAALGDYGETAEGYYVHILCGDCLVWRYIEASDEDCQWWETFVLDAYVPAMALAADTLDREAFEDEAETFIGALNAGAILPEDFR